MTLNKLIAAINVEEKSKAGYGGVKAPAQANLVEHKNHPGKNVKKEKAKPGYSGPKANAMKKKKRPEIVCYVCGGLDHKANRCHDRKGKGPTPDQQKVAKAQVHVAVATADVIGKGASTSGYVLEAFMANSLVSWQVDTCIFVLMRRVSLLYRA